MSGFMAYAINAEPTRKSYRGRAKEVNTPGNFKKYPKGAQEFSFYYVEKEEGKWFSCYARTEPKAYQKFTRFLTENNINT
jgi:hypothetical protein